MITSINNATIHTGEQVLEPQSLLIGNGMVPDIVPQFRVEGKWGS